MPRLNCNSRASSVARCVTRGCFEWLICGGASVLLYYAAVAAAGDAVDRRAYQHGIEFVSDGQGGHWLLWSSSGNPPQGQRTAVMPDGSRCRHFTHDIYYSRVTPDSPAIEPNLLIRLPEAQEPVSAASSRDGILLSFEDGSQSDISSECEGIIQQRFQFFDHGLNALMPLRTVRFEGGHSGHVAAVGGRFVIVYSEGWVPAADTAPMGTGKSIYLDVVSERGESQAHTLVSGRSDLRNWWPLIAGSTKYALLLWQSQTNDERRVTLTYAVYDPAARRFIKGPAALQGEVYPYQYDVQYLAGINRFLIVGNRLGELVRETGRGGMPLKTQQGFAYLLDEKGSEIAAWSETQVCEFCGGYHTHPFVREAQPAIRDQPLVAQVLYPVKPKGVLQFAVSAHAITLRKYIADDYLWHDLGTDGIFLDSRRAYFASLSPVGLQTRLINTD